MDSQQQQIDRLLAARPATLTAERIRLVLSTLNYDLSLDEAKWILQVDKLDLSIGEFAFIVCGNNRMHTTAAMLTQLAFDYVLINGDGSAPPEGVIDAPKTQR